jgi:hypothetical protein
VWYSIYVVYESASDAIFSIRYRRDADRFLIERGSESPTNDVAKLTLGDEDDFILFNNEHPGMVHSASHKGTNTLAIDALARAIFDSDYRLLCESLREGAKTYDTPERTGRILVPYSNKRRLARIALHAKASEAATHIQALHQRLVTVADEQLTSENDVVDADQPLSV